MDSFLEICTDSLSVAKLAALHGCGRIELCSGLSEGGLTPSLGLIEACIRDVDIPVRVLVRPRPGDFSYSAEEFRIMLRDIELIKETGADGVVFGLLTNQGRIDRSRSLWLVEAAQPMGVTFHRAFDYCRDPQEALEDIIELGFDTLLTSGQQPTVKEGVATLANLVQQARERICIMPGGGVRANLFPHILQQTGARVFHATLTQWKESGMLFRRPDLGLGTAGPSHDYLLRELNVEELETIVDYLENPLY
jgi:copper homeostasis protein